LQLAVYLHECIQKASRVIWSTTASDESTVAKEITSELEVPPYGGDGRGYHDAKPADRVQCKGVLENVDFRDIIVEILAFALDRQLSLYKLVSLISSGSLFEGELKTRVLSIKKNKLKNWTNPADASHALWDLGWWAARYGTIMTILVREMAHTETDMMREDKIRDMSPNGPTSGDLQQLFDEMVAAFRHNTTERSEPKFLFDLLIVNCMKSFEMGTTWKAGILAEENRRTHLYHSLTGSNGKWRYTLDDVSEMVTRVKELQASDRLTPVTQSFDQLAHKASQAKNASTARSIKSAAAKAVKTAKAAAITASKEAIATEAARLRTTAVTANKERNKQKKALAAAAAATPSTPSVSNSTFNVCDCCGMIHNPPYGKGCPVFDVSKNKFNIPFVVSTCPRRMKAAGDSNLMAVFIMNKVTRHSKHWKLLTIAGQQTFMTELKSHLKVDPSVSISASSRTSYAYDDDDGGYSSGDDSFYDEADYIPGEN
jgi:hypothetical protein